MHDWEYQTCACLPCSLQCVRMPTLTRQWGLPPSTVQGRLWLPPSGVFVSGAGLQDEACRGCMAMSSNDAVLLCRPIAAAALRCMWLGCRTRHVEAAWP